MTRKFGLIVCFFCFGFVLFAQNEDCSIAKDLVTVRTDLNEGLTMLMVDSITGPGEVDSIEAASMGLGELNPRFLRICQGPRDTRDNLPVPGTALPYSELEDKSYWFSFRVATAGTFEMLITPNEPADFDFMIWEGDCPSNPCAIPLVCGSQAPPIDVDINGNLVEAHSPTGLTGDPSLHLSSTQIWDSITLKENTNYFVLLDHKRSLTGLVSNTGCMVEFGGTAIIEPTKENPMLVHSFPVDTNEIVPVCIGTSTSFQVDLLGFDETVEYIWTTPSGEVSTTSDGDNEFPSIQQSGKVCVRIDCPIQHSICWEIRIDQIPSSDIITPDNTSCDHLILEDFVADAVGIELFNTKLDKLHPDSINIKGEYTLVKINGACRTSIPISSNPAFPKLVPNEFGTCDGLPFDLTTIIDQIDEINGFKEANNLEIIFYEDSSQAVNNDTPITMATSYKKYWAKGINANDCFDIVPINIKDAAPNIDPLIIPPSCEQIDLSTIPIIGASGRVDQSLISYVEVKDDPSTVLLSPIINNSGTYYAQINIGTGCSFFIDLNVIINQNPTINPINDIAFCQETNLDDANVVEANGIMIEKLYFTNEADANAPTAIAINSIIKTADTYWIKGTDPTTNCSSVVSVTLTTNEPSINGVPPIDECGDTYDLTNIIPSLTEATGTILDYSFYETAIAAEAGIQGESNIRTSGTYYIRGENLAITTSSCFDIQTVDVTLTTPNIRDFNVQKIKDGVFDLSEVPILNLDDGQRLVAAGYYRDSLKTMQLPSSVVTIEDTYWIEIIISDCSIIRPIEIRPSSNATFPKEIRDVDFPCTKEEGIDLSLPLSEITNSIDTDKFNIAFFNDEEDAEKGINALLAAALFIQEEGSVWLRKSDKTDNNNFGLIELILTERARATGGIVSIDKETCTDDFLEFQFTGSAPFNVKYTDGTNIFDLTIPSTDLVEEMVSPDGPTTYAIVSLEDQHGCDGLFDNNEPTFTPVSLNYTNPVTTCNDQATTYIVSFNILSGDFLTLDVDGNGMPGSLIDSQFISDPIPITDGYSFTITDKNHSNTGNCNPGTIASPIPPPCTCISEAAEMDTRTLEACVGEPILATVDKQAVIADNNDRTVYVLHDNATDQLGNIIATNNEEPQFTMTADLAGSTYYISAVTTNTTDLLQTPALLLSENRCLKVAVGTPVEVRATPTVSLTLEKDKSCFGESVELTFEMPEAVPYSLNFFDGNTAVNLANIRNGDTRSVSAEMETTFSVTSISYSNLSTCVNDMPDAVATLDIFEPITIQNRMENCEPDGTNFTVSFEIVGGDATSYTVDGTSENINGNLFESDLIKNKTNYTFSVSDGNGCMPAEVSDFGICLCTSDITTNIEVIQAVSCANESDGILKVNGINGELPYSFEWSNGTTGEQLNGLGAGWMYVSMTDGNLCEIVDSVELTGPEPIRAIVSPTDPSCSDLTNGSIVINNVQGGTRPYSYSINGETPKSVGLFANLPGREYAVVIEDDRGCQFDSIVSVTPPDDLNIWFTPNVTTLIFGDSLPLTVNANEDSLIYSWQNHPSLSCTDCSSPVIRPTETTSYSVTVTNQMDCTTSKEILIQVDNNKGLYSPTAFSPNGDGINDTFGLFGGNQVREIVRLQVFNRWGTLLYSRINLPTTDNFEDGWNGNETNGDRAPSGIYIYVAEVIYRDGTSEILTGDVALMR